MNDRRWKKIKQRLRKGKRNKRMRYLKIERSEKLPINVIKSAATDDKPAEMATAIELFSLLFKQYQPTQKLTLNTGDIRSLNRLIDLLEKPSDNGHYVMDEADWNTGKKIVSEFAPLTGWARNAPVLEDIWNGCPAEKQTV